MSEFRHQLPIQIRFNDVDQFGHVNNNSYFAFYDLGKQEYLSEVLDRLFCSGDIVPLVANINADFIVPIHYGDKLVMETRTVSIGNKSMVVEQRARNIESDTVYCTSRTIMVCYSLSENKSVRVPEEYRAAIEAYEGVSFSEKSE